MGLKYSVTALGCRPNTENVTMQHRNIHSNNNNKCKFSEFLDTTMSQDTAVADVDVKIYTAENSHLLKMYSFIETWCVLYDQRLNYMRPCRTCDQCWVRVSFLLSHLSVRCSASLSSLHPATFRILCLVKAGYVYMFPFILYCWSMLLRS